MSGINPALSEKPPAFALAILIALALAPLNTKIAGLAWLLWLVWALQLHIKSRRLVAPATTCPPTLLRAAQVWLWGVLAYAGVQLVMAWGWHGACCTYTSEVNSYLRLVLSALATVVLLRHLRPWPNMRHHINLSVVVALVAASVLAAVVGRDVPSHPIPWAGAMALLVCLLLPHAWDAGASAKCRWLYGAGAGLGMVAVVLSQSRGAYVVLCLPIFLALLHGLRSHRHSFAKVALVGAGLITLLGTMAWVPSDPLRLRLAADETQQALETQDFNSSVGARVFLAQFAWQHFKASPWVGVGAKERLRLLQTAGQELPPPQAASLSHVRTLGHVHNQYLHHAMDHGLVGLLGFFALLLSMVWASFWLYRVSALGAMQFGSITFIHTFVSFSNVNLAHNYYAVTLSLVTGWVFVQALFDRMHRR